MLFFVEASCGHDNLNWFVRAENPRRAFELWRSSDFVLTMDPMLNDVDGPVKVWRVPDPEGPIGAVDWVYADAWEGRAADEFPESVEEE